MCISSFRRLALVALITLRIDDVSALSFSLSSTGITSDRRSIIANIASTSIGALIYKNDSPALAIAPFAPVDTLLPAARVKCTLDRAVIIASNLMQETDVDQKQGNLHDLKSLLLENQNYNQGTTPLEVPQQPAKSYLESYAEYRNRVSLLEKPGAMLVQKGEIDAWKRLKREEKAREDADEVRAALNYYTSNLNFDSEKIALTAPKEVRSKLIREDRIPDVKTVIASDMGLRYLLRNDLLTSMDDIRAELKYLIEQPIMNVDGTDLYELLVVAQTACNNWFDLIDEKDTLAALEIVRKEKLL